MHEIKTERGSIFELTMGDRLVFKHGRVAKIYTVPTQEKLYLLGKHAISRRGNVHEVLFTDPLMDLQFDEMGIMADLSVVINTNIINTLLVFKSLENAQAFLNGSKNEDLIRETVSIQAAISRVPVTSLDSEL